MHLHRASKGRLHVKKIGQWIGKPSLSENHFLGKPQREQALIREVILQCNDEPWVFARSIVPISSLKGPLRQLRLLGNQPLGALIFKEPSMRRSAFEISLIPGDSTYIHPNWRQPGEAWGRRSKFHMHGHPLLVSEVYLESFRY